MAPESHVAEGRQERIGRAKTGECPLCGREYDDVTELHWRKRDGEKEHVPGIIYDHGTTCIEWADGEKEIRQ